MLLPVAPAIHRLTAFCSPLNWVAGGHGSEGLGSASGGSSYRSDTSSTGSSGSSSSSSAAGLITPVRGNGETIASVAAAVEACRAAARVLSADIEAFYSSTADSSSDCRAAVDELNAISRRIADVIGVFETWVEMSLSSSASFSDKLLRIASKESTTERVRGRL